MKYALITGGGGGLGYALAETLARQGYGIAVAGSHPGRLAGARARLAQLSPHPVYAYVQDLAQPGAARTLFERVSADGLDIALLVNNAGFGLAGRTEEIDFARDEALMALNNAALVGLCKLFLPGMYQKGRGKILNVASTGAFQPGPYTSTYFASKAFVLSYSRAIRQEAAPRGVQVCAVCPGATRTQFFASEGLPTPAGAMPAERVARYACKRLAKNKAVSVPGLANRLTLLAPQALRMARVARLKAPK